MSPRQKVPYKIAHIKIEEREEEEEEEEEEEVKQL